jgi:protein O-mannosyl-transferase
VYQVRTKPYPYGQWAVLLLMVCCSALIYVPWRDNPLIFDDHLFLGGSVLMDYAMEPFKGVPRQFPYFTLGFEHLMFGPGWQPSRYVNLVLHALTSFVLYLLSQRLLTRVCAAPKARALAVVVALLFVVHPVAVYAVGYLTQRTIVLATFFALCSAWQLDKALAATSWRRAVWAGVLYILAVLSKEHAVSLAVGIAAVAIGHMPPPSGRAKRALAAFGALACVGAVWMVIAHLGLLGTTYEPDVQTVLDESSFATGNSRWANWALSAAMQSAFFFRYVQAWYAPAPHTLSIDIRPDMNAWAQWPLLAVGPVAFAVLAALVLWGLCSRKAPARLRLAAWGMLWALSAFVVEFSTVRFQEPLVLYRSYLWAPGLLLALVALLSGVRLRWLAPAAVAALVLLAVLAWGRLQVFSSSLALWQEAQAQLPTPTTSGALRIHYNVALHQLQQGNTAEALRQFDWVIDHSRNSMQGYWGRSMVHIQQKNWRAAQDDVQTVLRYKPQFGTAYVRLAYVYFQQGLVAESEAAMDMAVGYGQTRVQFGKK